MATWYVHKGVGSDSNTGTSWGSAFASLNKAKNVSGNNDTIFVRAGTTPYQEQLGLGMNGQRWLADAGHQPIIDGKYHENLADKNLYGKPPNLYVVQKTTRASAPSIVNIGGNDNILEGFRIQNVAARGMTITGSRNIVRNCRFDWIYSVAVMVNSAGVCEDNLLEDSEISRASIGVYATNDWGPEPKWGRPYSAGISTKHVLRTTFRRCKVYHCWGEGITTGSDTDEPTIEFCESFNNHHMNFYVNNCRNATIRFNKGWSTRLPELVKEAGGKDRSSEPIVISSEIDNAAYMVNNRIYGNVFVGGWTCMTLARKGSRQRTILRDCYIGYNTFISLPGVNEVALSGATVANHSNSIFENNIIYVVPGIDFMENANDPFTGLRGRGNLIYAPGRTINIPNWMNGAGTIQADPKLVNATAAVVDNGGVVEKPKDGTNNFSPNNYKLTGSSPAVNAAQTSFPFNGLTGPETARARDLFGAARSNPDIGMHEYGGVVENSVVASFSRSPAATTIAQGQTVNFTNTSFTTGTATITGETWKVKKGGTQVATATTEHYSYTFTTTGSYTVELTVTATGGLSDTEIIAYTVVEGGGGVVVQAAFMASPTQTTNVAGTTYTFTNLSQVQNGTLGSLAWAVLPLPSGAAVATGTGETFVHTFGTAGSWRVRLTATATTGESDQVSQDYTINSVTTPTVTVNFTASDADLVIDEGDAITFTNTSSAANTTITGYEWTITSLEGGGETTYTTTNITHTFGQSGLYRVRLLANTAAGVSDEHVVYVTVQGDAHGGMTFMAVPVQFALNTATGTQTVTAAALGTLVPRGVHVRLTAATALGTAVNDALLSDGAADGASQWVHVRFSKSGAAAGTAWRRYATDALILAIDDTGAVTGRASLIRFVAGGMEIDVSDGFPAGYIAEAIFYAGDDCRFWAGTVTTGTLDAAVPVTTGFLPKAVYASACWATEEDTAQTRAELSWGWALGNGAQYCIRNEDRHGNDPTYLRTRVVDNYLATTSQGDGKDLGALAYVEAGNFDINGFTLTARTKGIGLPLSCYAVATGDAAVHLSREAMGTGGSSTHALTEEPQTVLALLSTATATGLVGSDQAVGFGAATHSMHGSYSATLSIASANAASTSSTQSLAADGFRAVNHNGANLYNGTTAVDADSFDITWSAAPAAAYLMILLAFEKGVIVTVGDEPVANFAQEIDFGEGRTDRAVVWFDGTLSNDKGYDASYSWDLGDGNTSTEIQPMHVYTQAGEYTVSLTVTTSQGSSTKIKESLVVYESPSAEEWLVGLAQPETVGGPTENVVGDATRGHSHAARFPYAHFEALDEAGVADFLAMPPDPVYALWAWDDANQRVIIKRPDGTHWAITSAAI